MSEFLTSSEYALIKRLKAEWTPDRSLIHDFRWAGPFSETAKVQIRNIGQKIGLKVDFTFRDGVHRIEAKRQKTP